MRWLYHRNFSSTSCYSTDSVQKHRVLLSCAHQLLPSAVIPSHSCTCHSESFLHYNVTTHCCDVCDRHVRNREGAAALRDSPPRCYALLLSDEQMCINVRDLGRRLPPMRHQGRPSQWHRARVVGTITEGSHVKGSLYWMGFAVLLAAVVRKQNSCLCSTTKLLLVSITEAGPQERLFSAQPLKMLLPSALLRLMEQTSYKVCTACSKYSAALFAKGAPA